MSSKRLPSDQVMEFTTFEVVGIELDGRLFLTTREKIWKTLFFCAVYRALTCKFFIFCHFLLAFRGLSLDVFGLVQFTSIMERN